MPKSDENITTLIRGFESIGLSTVDLVTLSGAHTIGFTHCIEFASRIFHNDTTLNSTIREKKSLRQRKGLLLTDHVLAFGENDVSRKLVYRYSEDQELFFQEFAKAMLKLGRVGVKTGNEGEIRRDWPGCARISHRKGIQLDAVARGALICGYCGTGEVGIALELHREIVKWNCSPNVITYAKRKTCSFVLICSGLLDCFYESLRSSISRFQFWYMELCVDDVPPIQRKVTSGKASFLVSFAVERELYLFCKFTLWSCLGVSLLIINDDMSGKEYQIR
ncbi:hypothetical protein C5167_042711 [Papaver somniferum]|uniref:L-ascorbate peroxidase n=1 Tax=Papaver somniferum TaxID=3469 RepID=A0A4Y7L3K1_PAPSO|nr:hypothetical protein C5167_042711 [Papaver somniferum]